MKRFGLENRMAVALSLLLLIISAAGCQGQASSKTSTSASNASALSGKEKVVGVDAGRAYEHMTKLVAMGPHPPGSAAIKKAQDYIKAEIKGYGLRVIEDRFDAQTTKGVVPMNNIIAELPGQKTDTIMIAGHYDTKPQAGFLGANDGCSSTAAVLEMARVLAKSKPEYTLWFVFFDGEEAFVDWNANDGMDNTYGSRHMASKMKADGSISRIKALVLVDMIGDKDLDLLKDYESTPWLMEAIWNTAQQAGMSKYFLKDGSGYSDDHLAFKEVGVPVVDIIDFNYGPDNSYWHTDKDTLEHVSGESVKIVCDVVIKALPEISKHLNNSNGASH